MTRNIVICIDGTGNDPNDALQPGSDTTNVFRLTEALVHDDRQLVKYFPGVATSGDPFLDFAGKYTGLGAEQLRDGAYHFLLNNYRAGDDIYLFGFSRGAAIVRDLANHMFDHGTGDLQGARISMLGLWDTVAAFGIPVDLGTVPTQSINIGKKLDIPPNVQHTVHLLAIDEQRAAYAPTLVEAADTVEEVWFAGTHCDVGGGFRERDLANITLWCMIERAQQQGLRFKQSTLRVIPRNECGEGVIHCDVEAKAPHQSRAIVVQMEHLVSTMRPKLHKSVVERMNRQDYAPENVKRLNGNFEVTG
jgi:uncharacterized protein (DUF2235 family)